MSDARKARCLLNCQIAGSIINIVLGPAAFLVFILVYGNIQAGVYGLLAGVASGVHLHLNLCYKFSNLRKYWPPRTLRISKKVAVVVLVLSFLGAITEFVLAGTKVVPMEPFSGSTILAGIQLLLITKTCLYFTCVSSKYLAMLEDSALIQEDTQAEEEEVI